MSAAVAIKVSAELAESARAEALHTDRSLTGQIEHWAKLGRVMETKMTVPVVNALKRTQGNLELIEDPELKQQVMAAFQAFRQLAAQDKLAQLGLGQQVRFEPDPQVPGGVIRITPDGQREVGTMKGRAFVPAKP